MSIARVAALPSRRTLIVFAALVSAATGAIDSRAATPALPESDPAHAADPGSNQGAGVDYALTAEAGSQRFLHFSTAMNDVSASEYEVVWFIRDLAREPALPLISACKLQPLPARKKKS